MRVLVTGRNGQVAKSLAERAHFHPALELLFAGRPDFDLADPDSVRRTLERTRPDIVISAAAYTAVDRAEEDSETAMTVNAAGPALLAERAHALSAPVIHLSTDYVYDGKGDTPYREEAPIAPINAYGRSKYAGEEAVRAAQPDHLILRTAWIYSPFGKNFVKTMLALAEDRDRLRVVDDQIGNPTSALDIADAVLAIAERWGADGPLDSSGTYHFAGRGETSWAGFARHALACSREFGGPFAEVDGIASCDWPALAPRPHNSRLDCTKFQVAFDHAGPDWRHSVRATVKRLVEDRPAPTPEAR